MVNAALNLVVIRASDLERAARFYAALGIRLSRERHGSGPEHLADQATDGRVIGVVVLLMGDQEVRVKDAGEQAEQAADRLVLILGEARCRVA